VARNVLSYVEKFNLPYANFSIRGIDAKGWFNASVDACLFTLEYNEIPNYVCPVYSSLTSLEPSHSIGVVEGRLVADMDRYTSTVFADGKSPAEWRSGVKHDAAAVMELANEMLPEMELETEYVFPLLKCTDLFRGRLEPKRSMVVPQHNFGEDTGHLEFGAPNLWKYLQSNRAALDSRGSSIYKVQPRFAVFGLGPYTFQPYKIAISGLHKEVRFVLLGPIEGKPIVVDDACYILSFDEATEAVMTFALLNSPTALNLLKALIFWDSKRPISKKLLQRLDLRAIALATDLHVLETIAQRASGTVGIDQSADWAEVLRQLLDRWNKAAPQLRRRTKTASVNLIDLTAIEPAELFPLFN
jgi:hypothetical protein